VRLEAPRGTHDVLASDWPHWELIEREAKRLCALYGYARITTPTFEDTDLFSRTSGAGSDVVQKEMYTFSDRSDRSITLRPEATAPIARAYLEHGLYRDPQPVKLFTIAPMFRYSAPQRGRYREHWQLSVEAIGSSDPAVDAEVVQLYAELLRALGVSEWTLLLNSIGDENCRPAYLERLTAWLDDHAESLGEEGREKRATSPLRVFDVTDAVAQEALAGAPKIGESLCAECAAHFAQAAMTGSSPRSGGRRLPESASGQAWSGSTWPSARDRGRRRSWTSSSPSRIPAEGWSFCRCSHACGPKDGRRTRTTRAARSRAS
jgi:histidyl-tRNA synthetase